VEVAPLHGTVAREIAEVFPAARFVHVLRDGRDVAVSVRAAARSWAPGWPASVLKSAWRWRKALRNASQAQPVLGDRLLEVRYEDLKSEPQAQIARLFRFCGMPYDMALVGRVATHTDFRRQFKPDPAAFRRFGRVGDWRTALTPLDVLLFAIGAGDTLVNAGYEASRIWWVRHIAAARLRRRRSRKTLPRAS
jgi:sulfotransferase family protein